jgi:glycosyltransferase involved in cell wall biosynthesis
MNTYGLVSIITPSWNCAKFVEETIQSLLAQTYAHWELLFQDDCSTDNTKEIVLAYAEKDARIKYACNPQNSGAAITRNNALKRSKGKWIAFLDSDDLWLPSKLEEQLQFMVDNNYAFSYTNYNEINEQSDELGKSITGPKHITKYGMYAYCWPGCLTVMYNQETVGNIQIKHIEKNNDYALWLKVIQYADCHLLDKTLAKYRKRTGSISNHSYVQLIKWHYRLFHESEQRNMLLSTVLTIGNLIFGTLKKILYIKNI